ncbi:MFS transporter [Anaplasmataceae bacterium AB001_6]|nr:MFS transporter [Anaplasmataceae bacterium AB001_6]
MRFQHIMALAFLISFIDYDFFVILLPKLNEYFSTTDVTGVLNFNTIGILIALLLSSFIENVRTLRKIITLSICCYAISLTMFVMYNDYPVFLTIRFSQGVIQGASYMFGYRMLKSMSPKLVREVTYINIFSCTLTTISPFFALSMVNYSNLKVLLFIILLICAFLLISLRIIGVRSDDIINRDKTTLHFLKSYNFIFSDKRVFVYLFFMLVNHLWMYNSNINIPKLFYNIMDITYMQYVCCIAIYTLFYLLGAFLSVKIAKNFSDHRYLSNRDFMIKCAVSVIILGHLFMLFYDHKYILTNPIRFEMFLIPEAIVLPIIINFAFSGVLERLPVNAVSKTLLFYYVIKHLSNLVVIQISNLLNAQDIVTYMNIVTIVFSAISVMPMIFIRDAKTSKVCIANHSPKGYI